MEKLTKIKLKEKTIKDTELIDCLVVQVEKGFPLKVKEKKRGVRIDKEK